MAIWTSGLAGRAPCLAGWALGLASWASGLAEWSRGEGVEEGMNRKSPQSTEFFPLLGPIFCY